MFVILSNSVAISANGAILGSRTRMALVCRFAIPVNCLLVVLSNSVAIAVHNAHEVLRIDQNSACRATFLLSSAILWSLKQILPRLHCALTRPWLAALRNHCTAFLWSWVTPSPFSYMKHRLSCASEKPFFAALWCHSTACLWC